VLKAWCAVLPANTPLFPVGGIQPENMAAFRNAGATGFGIGSALFKPGMTVAAVHQQAIRFRQAWAGLR
jgi:2-dehydro-3-deoxyphosphogalactonate aldolase